MKILFTVLYLLLSFSPVLALSTPALSTIADTALSKSSDIAKIKVKNAELQMQIAKQKRLNAKTKYQKLILQEKISNLLALNKSKAKELQDLQQPATQKDIVKNDTTPTNPTHNLNTKVNKPKPQLQNTQIKLTNIKAQHKKAQQANVEKIQYLQTDLQTAQSLIMAQKDQLSSQQKQLEHLQQRIVAFENQAKRNTSEITQLTQKNAQLNKGQADKTQAEIAKLKQALQQQTTKTNYCQTQFNNLQNRSVKMLESCEQATIISSQSNQLPADSQPVVNNDVEAQFKLAHSYRANNNNKLALQAYLKVAEKGYASAQFNVANMYYNGLGIERDAQQAFVFYLQAAEQGLIEAQYNVALMLSKGEGVEQNNAQSFFWHKKAASQGHQTSQAIINSL